MKRLTETKKCVSVFGLLLLIAASSSWAEEKKNYNFGRFEAAVGLSWHCGCLDTTYQNEYSTPFAFSAGENKSSASQSLYFQGEGSWSFDGTLNIFFHQNFGLQILGGSFKTPLFGENSPYNIDFTYTARHPPDYVSREFEYTRDLDWSDTEGQLTKFYLCVNGVVRLPLGRSVSTLLSGGMSYLKLSGEAASLGYSKFWLGGHSVLFSEHHRLEFSMGPEKKIGFNIGLEIAFSLHKNIHLLLNFRHFIFAKSSLDIHLIRILNLDEIIMQTDTLEQMEQNMNLLPLEFGLSFPRVSLGLKLSLF
ncbi:MAG: hypothetical protein PVF22_02995 [Candidatus Aminicenantes bacterium]|jgi:hypothetical protein